MSESDDLFAVCPVCPHQCVISEGKKGKCRGRGAKDGSVIPLNYGIVTSLALDPIEKKPLYHFFPKSKILSVGSYGCNLNCPFCQNWEISMADGNKYEPRRGGTGRFISPDELAEMAMFLKSKGNIGVAFTYNEPLISYEYVIDTAKILRKNDLKVVLVTNGCVNERIAAEILPLVDAMNIDLKSFRSEVYSKTLGGDLNTVKDYISRAAEQCHVELTCLVVPGMNDSEEEMMQMSNWIRSLHNGDIIPLHITRFFPRYKVLDKKPTDKEVIYRLVEVAKSQLKYVYSGNM